MTADIPVVRDHFIPITKYPSLKETQTLSEAVQVILSYTCGNDRLMFSEILVLNDQNQLVGHLNLQSILKALDKRLADIPEVKGHEGKGAQFPNLSILWEESFFHTCPLKRDIPIRDVMRSTSRYAKSGDSLIKALAIILEDDEDILPVVENDSIIGVIRLEEIFKAICCSCNL
ncbi:MAG: CBS domain-containing protein [Proteobacteria bacterium]|nr:CBS domain-containing protein [Pseudomonadota bacterium]